MVRNLYSRRPDFKETEHVGHSPPLTSTEPPRGGEEGGPPPHGDAAPHLPLGLKAKDLLQRSGYEVEDHHLTTREQTDAFKAQHGVATTPQVSIGGERVGGYDDPRPVLGKP